MTGLLAAGLLAPFFFEVTPEVRTSYVSLGKLMEDRPMQVTYVRFGYDTEKFGRFGIRNWDVSSLTGRRSDVHSHAFYHTELGPTWQYDLDLADGWTLKSDITRSWTFYRRFNSAHAASNRTYNWWQMDQSLTNPYIVPFYRIRKCFRGNDYTYFMAGVRRRLTLRACGRAGGLPLPGRSGFLTTAVQSIRGHGYPDSNIRWRGQDPLFSGIRHRHLRKSL